MSRGTTYRNMMSGKQDYGYYHSESELRALNTLYDYKLRLEKTEPKRKRGGR